MAESYFKDPLLAKWEQAIDARTAAMIRRMGSTANPIVVYNQLPGCDDKDNLYLAILAELSGARRARERAEQLTSHKYLLGAYPNGGLVKIGAERAAREILEAFDGE